MEAALEALRQDRKEAGMQETEIDRMLRQMQETYRALDAAPLQLQRDRAAHEKALRLQAEYEDLKKAAAALTAETAAHVRLREQWEAAQSVYENAAAAALRLDRLYFAAQAGIFAASLRDGTPARSVARRIIPPQPRCQRRLPAKRRWRPPRKNATHSKPGAGGSAKRPAG